MKSYVVKVKHPNLGKGKSISITGLGVFKNGTRKKISAERVASYEAIHGEGSFEAALDNCLGIEYESKEVSPAADNASDDAASDGEKKEVNE